MTTAKEKQRYFTNYFYESLYKEKEYKLRIAQLTIYTEFTEIYLNSARSGEVFVRPCFNFKHKELRNVAIKAGVDHFAFDNIGGTREGTRMACEIEIFDHSKIYSPKYSYSEPPVLVNKFNYIEHSGVDTVYDLEDISEVVEAFLHHKYFMEVVGFQYIEMMKTPEGVDKIYNDVILRKDIDYLLSEKGRDCLIGFYSPPLRVIYSLISAKLVSDERYRAVLERHKMLRYENDLIVEYFEKIVKYFG